MTETGSNTPEEGTISNELSLEQRIAQAKADREERARLRHEAGVEYDKRWKNWRENYKAILAEREVERARVAQANHWKMNRRQAEEEAHWKLMNQRYVLMTASEALEREIEEERQKEEFAALEIRADLNLSRQRRVLLEAGEILENELKAEEKQRIEKIRAAIALLNLIGMKARLAKLRSETTTVPLSLEEMANQEPTDPTILPGGPNDRVEVAFDGHMTVTPVETFTNTPDESSIQTGPSRPSSEDLNPRGGGAAKAGLFRRKRIEVPKKSSIEIAIEAAEEKYPRNRLLVVEGYPVVVTEIKEERGQVRVYCYVAKYDIDIGKVLYDKGLIQAGIRSYTLSEFEEAFKGATPHSDIEITPENVNIWFTEAFKAIQKAQSKKTEKDFAIAIEVSEGEGDIPRPMERSGTRKIDQLAEINALKEALTPLIIYEARNPGPEGISNLFILGYEGLSAQTLCTNSEGDLSPRALSLMQLKEMNLQPISEAFSPSDVKEALKIMCPDLSPAHPALSLSFFNTEDSTAVNTSGSIANAASASGSFDLSVDDNPPPDEDDGIILDTEDENDQLNDVSVELNLAVNR